MDTDIQRNMDEWITMYQTEPNLRDLFVEGPNDKVFFDIFLRELDCKPVSVFEIGCVRINPELINKYNLKQGNRDRIIAFSLELENALKQYQPFLLCIADSDFDFLLGRKHNSRYLFYTDYTSIDLYFYSERILSKLLKLVVRKNYCEVSKLLPNLEFILREVFLIRATNEELEWCLQLIDFTKYCKINKDRLIEFNKHEFIKRCLSKNNRLGQKDIFLGTLDKQAKKKVKDIKYCICGEDYYVITSWYIANLLKKNAHKYNTPDLVRQMSTLSVNLALLAQEVLFRNLLKKYN